MKKTEILLRVVFCVGIIICGFACYTCVSAFADTTSGEIPEVLTSLDVLRLHVIAPGDSTQDQLLKFDVRDAVLNEAMNLLMNINDVDTAIEICSENLIKFEEVSEEILREKNDPRSVKASLEIAKFPSMSYGKTTLPEDDYLALRIEIGEAEGANWWCVLFPSLCLVDLQSAKIVQVEKTPVMKKSTTLTNMQIRYELPEWIKRAMNKGSKIS